MAAADAEYFPAAHAVQLVSETEPITAEYVPAGHPVQLEYLGHTLLYVPGGHVLHWPRVVVVLVKM